MAPLLYIELCHQMQQKAVASAVFRGKKEGYAESLNKPFANSRIGKHVSPFTDSFASF